MLYNDLSGDTHLLDEIALHLLHTLRDGPAAGGRWRQPAQGASG